MNLKRSNFQHWLLAAFSQIPSSPIQAISHLLLQPICFSASHNFPLSSSLCGTSVLDVTLAVSPPCIHFIRLCLTPSSLCCVFNNGANSPTIPSFLHSFSPSLHSLIFYHTLMLLWNLMYVLAVNLNIKATFWHENIFNCSNWQTFISIMTLSCYCWD